MIAWIGWAFISSGFAQVSAPVPQPRSICSTLSFAGVTWSTQLAANERTAFQLALNISGSFEGRAGWANISNNFDGQGLSLGLLNQGLGTGSLQPLLSQMRVSHGINMSRLFSAVQWQSLGKMLDRYDKWAAQTKGELKTASLSRAPLLWRYDLYGEEMFSQPGAGGPVQSLGIETHGVSWAITNIYTTRSGRVFKTDWWKSLVSLAADQNYVSIQVKAAEMIHTQALSLMSKTGLKELRSYLTLFDFVVQNGGIYDIDLDEYTQNVAKNPKWNEVDRLTHLLTLRLRHVRARYVNDVRSRKMAVISGVGIVHRLRRSLEQEYCYRGSDPF